MPKLAQMLCRCGRFYPSNVKTAEDRLATYSRHFPCVEVDSSCYAIPKPSTTAKWTQHTPPGFKFHFKAFGFFCSRSAPANALPWQVRQHLPVHLQVSVLLGLKALLFLCCCLRCCLTCLMLAVGLPPVPAKFISFLHCTSVTLIHH